jgi:hypothetical protein
MEVERHKHSRVDTPANVERGRFLGRQKHASQRLPDRADAHGHGLTIFRRLEGLIVVDVQKILIRRRTRGSGWRRRAAFGQPPGRGDRL